jgi:hypothetical protein
MTFHTHTPRHIQFIELWTFYPWKIKIYSICESEDLWDAGYINIAKSIAESQIRKLPKTTEHHNSAFLTIHIARMFNQIIFDWWAQENELRHLVFKAKPESPLSFVDITHTGEAFCVWELKVIGHERGAWMKHVLQRHERPDFIGYYEDVLDCVV